MIKNNEFIDFGLQSNLICPTPFDVTISPLHVFSLLFVGCNKIESFGFVLLSIFQFNKLLDAPVLTAMGMITPFTWIGGISL